MRRDDKLDRPFLAWIICRKGLDCCIQLLDEDLLRRIAEETGGRFFRARDEEALTAIYNQIDKLEKSKVEITAYKKFEERFLPFVLAALGCLVLEWILRLTIFRRFP